MNYVIFYFYTTIGLYIMSFIFLQLKIKKSFYFNFSFFWFNIFFLFIPFYAQYSQSTFPWGGKYSDSTIIYSYIIVVTFLISYIVGYLINYKQVSKTISINYKKKTNFFFMILLLINLVLTLFLMKTTLLTIYILPRGFIYNFNSFDIILYLMTKFTWVFLLLLNYLVLYNKSIFYKILFYFILIINLILLNPLSNPRFIFLGFFILLGFLFFKWNFFGSLKKSSFILLFLFYFETTILRIVKHLDSFFASQNKFEQLFQFNLSYFLGINFDAYQQLLNTIEYINKTGKYDFFYSIISGLLFFVPRSIWPEKAISTGEVIADFKDYQYTNLSEPIVANLYLSAGFIGVTLGGILIGFTFRRLDNILYKYVYFKETSFMTLFSLGTTGFIMIFFRGAFNATFPMYGILVYLTIIFYFVNKLVIKSPDEK